MSSEGYPEAKASLLLSCFQAVYDVSLMLQYQTFVGFWATDRPSMQSLGPTIASPLPEEPGSRLLIANRMKIPGLGSAGF